MIMKKGSFMKSPSKVIYSNLFHPNKILYGIVIYMLIFDVEKLSKAKDQDTDLVNRKDQIIAIYDQSLNVPWHV